MSDPSTSPLPGLPRRVLDVFFSPGKLFDQLRDKPAWGGAVLLVVALNLVTLSLMPAELFQEQLQQALEQSGGDTGEISVETVAAITRTTGIAMAGVTGAVSAFVIAAIMFFVFATLLGDGGRYRQYLSVAAHTLIISSVGGLLVVPLRIAQGDMQLMLSIGTFLPLLEDGSLRTFLSLLDLFTLWAVMLAALGVSKIHPGRSWGAAFAVLMAFWLVFTGAMTALTSLGG